jgi:hypothetical protein
MQRAAGGGRKMSCQAALGAGGNLERRVIQGMARAACSVRRCSVAAVRAREPDPCMTARSHRRARDTDRHTPRHATRRARHDGPGENSLASCSGRPGGEFAGVVFGAARGSGSASRGPAVCKASAPAADVSAQRRMRSVHPEVLPPTSRTSACLLRTCCAYLCARSSVVSSLHPDRRTPRTGGWR